MDNKPDYFFEKYCAQCYKVLDWRFKNGVCPVCGQKTSALNINQRLKFDKSIEKKDRCALIKAAAMMGIASLLQLAYSIIALLAFTGVIGGSLGELAASLPEGFEGLNTALSAAFILLSAAGAALSAGILADADRSVSLSMRFLEKIAPAVVISLNLASLGLYIGTYFYLDKLHKCLGCDKLQLARQINVYNAKNPLGSENTWCCKYCGYINSKRDNECKSCGKNK